MENGERYITVSMLSDQIKTALEVIFPGTIYLRGEISGYRPSSTGHWYLTLKDDDSVISAIVFKSQQGAIIEGFRSAGISAIKDGQEVLVEGRINLYKKGGSYSLVINKMMPLGIGGLYIQFEELKRKLAAKGFFESDQKQPLPPHPETVGLITSPTGAALQDMLNVLRRRAPSIAIKLFPVSVQGDAAKNEIAAAIKYADYQYRHHGPHRVDVLIIARGGGSIEDLWAFNEEIVAEAVHECSVPVISGIGHEIDFTITDFCADLRAPTPSAAAELVARSNEEVINNIAACHLRIQGAMNNLLTRYQSRYDRVESLRLERAMQRLYEEKMQDYLYLSERMRNYFDTIYLEKKHLYEIAAQRLVSLNPLQILERGFAVVNKKPANQIVTSANALTHADEVELIFKDGKINAVVE